MNERHWLDHAEEGAWRAYLAMHARLTARLHRDLLVRCELSLAEYDVLVQLTDAGESRLRLFELGEALQWEKSRVSKQVARMTARGLVAREECPEDKRGAFVVLTDAGRAAIENAAPDHVALVRRLVFDALDASQVEAWTQVSERVLDRLAAEPTA